VIFLTVGNWHKGFNRLIEAVDRLVAEEIICDEVVGQIGHSSYRPRHFQAVEFCSSDAFVKWVQEADCVVSHAGMGTIAQTLKYGKPTVVVPRKVELGEISNQHQFDTCEQLELERKILVAYEVDQLPKKLEEAKSFVPDQADTSKGILEEVRRFIEGIAATKAAANG